jgi:hypothetical protein
MQCMQWTNLIILFICRVQLHPKDGHIHTCTHTLLRDKPGLQTNSWQLVQLGQGQPKKWTIRKTPPKNSTHSTTQNV